MKADFPAIGDEIVGGLTSGTGSGTRHPHPGTGPLRILILTDG
jgi:hypothetical protein